MNPSHPEPRAANPGSGSSLETIVSARGLDIRYHGIRAVRGIDFAVSCGEVVGLIGPDGAGKTSTLRAIAGLHRPTAGTTEVLGMAVWQHRRALHRRLGYLAQRFALYGDLTVDENIRFFALLYGLRKWRPRRDVLLERVGLTPFRERPADRLSGGMRQKLALVCSLMHSPEILLLDEPTTGVDPVTRREFWRLLAELVAEGLTMVVATPYLDEAERCSRVVLMHKGRVLADALPGELPQRLPGTVVEVVATPRATVTATLLALPGVLDVQPFADRFHVRIEGAAVSAIGDALAAAGAEVSGVRWIAAGLEDTFLYLVRQAEEAA